MSNQPSTIETKLDKLIELLTELVNYERARKAKADYEDMQKFYRDLEEAKKTNE